jgi:hypothetical protein
MTPDTKATLETLHETFMAEMHGDTRHSALNSVIHLCRVNDDVRRGYELGVAYTNAEIVELLNAADEEAEDEYVHVDWSEAASEADGNTVEAVS